MRRAFAAALRGGLSNTNRNQPTNQPTNQPNPTNQPTKPNRHQPTDTNRQALGGCLVFLDELDSLATSRDKEMHEVGKIAAAYGDHNAAQNLETTKEASPPANSHPSLETSKPHNP
jgi:hypothetical protein